VTRRAQRLLEDQPPGTEYRGRQGRLDDASGRAGRCRQLRIQSWRLNKDWSIDIAAKTVTPSMYDLTVGPKPADVVPAPLPGWSASKLFALGSPGSMAPAVAVCRNL